MGKLSAGLAAYLAKKNGMVTTPTTANGVPMVPMHPQMLSSIKAAPKGKLPAGLQRYLDAKKKGKPTVKAKKSYNFKKVGKSMPKITGKPLSTKGKKKISDQEIMAKMEKKLGIVQH